MRSQDGTVLGTRVLEHPHVNEQPLTRSLGGVVIAETKTAVFIAAQDFMEGYCGSVFILTTVDQYFASQVLLLSK